MYIICLKNACLRIYLNIILISVFPLQFMDIGWYALCSKHVLDKLTRVNDEQLCLFKFTVSRLETRCSDELYSVAGITFSHPSQPTSRKWRKYGMWGIAPWLLWKLGFKFTLSKLLKQFYELENQIDTLNLSNF